MYSKLTEMYIFRAHSVIIMFCLPVNPLKIALNLVNTVPVYSFILKKKRWSCSIPHTVPVPFKQKINPD